MLKHPWGSLYFTSVIINPDPGFLILLFANAVFVEWGSVVAAWVGIFGIDPSGIFVVIADLTRAAVAVAGQAAFQKHFFIGVASLQRGDDILDRLHLDRFDDGLDGGDYHRSTAGFGSHQRTTPAIVRGAHSQPQSGHSQVEASSSSPESAAAFRCGPQQSSGM